jgi:hypothetical protein
MRGFSGLLDTAPELYPIASLSPTAGLFIPRRMATLPLHGFPSILTLASLLSALITQSGVRTLITPWGEPIYHRVIT